MKVFISHSTHDRFVARMVAQQVASVGVSTFLDEKDLTTGAPLVGIISRHLLECDQLLVIASPESLRSHWVSMEIGAAIAAHIDIVVLLHHVSPSQLPQPVDASLARDLNDLDTYLQELRDRLASSEVGRPLGLGDRVRVRPAPVNDPPGGAVSWVDSMDRYVGRMATIISLATDATARLDVDGSRHWWHLDWLELVEPTDTSPPAP